MARRVAADLADVADDADLVDQDVADDVVDGEDDEAESDDELDAADDDGAEDPAPEPERRRRTPARRETADPALIVRLEAAERRAEQAERTAREAAERYQQRQEPAPESPEQEAAKIALMTPAEFAQYQQKKLDTALARHTQVIQRSNLQSANAADKATFGQFVATSPNPAVKKLADQVERKHSDLLAQGQTPSRMDVLTYMLGERALKQAQTPQAQRQAADRRGRVERQQVRPGSAASDVRGQRRGGQTLEDRLVNVAI